MDYPDQNPEFSITKYFILHKGRIWLSSNLPFLHTLLLEYHCTPTSGHVGVAKTLARLTKNFYWQGIRKDVERFVASCVDCQHTKYETQRPIGLLFPLLVPCRPWEDLSLDFIIGLSAFRGNTAILVIVDRFSKGIHLAMLPTHHTAYTVAVLFMDLVGKLHSMPRSLVSDCDPLFLSKFWQELFHLSGTKLRLSSAYHPQSDGQTEVLNRVIEQYLRAFVHKKPSSWGKLLGWVEWSYNTSWNSSSGLTLYEITFGKKPFNFPQYLTGDSNIDVVDVILTDREAVFTEIKKKLEKAQNRMKYFADKKRREAQFKVGDMVLVKLRPHRQTSVSGQPSGYPSLLKDSMGLSGSLNELDPQLTNCCYRKKLVYIRFSTAPS